MRKIFVVIIGIFFAVLLVACGKAINSNTEKRQPSEQEHTQYEHDTDAEIDDFCIEYEVDLTHDGNNENIKVTIMNANKQEDAEVKVLVSDTQGPLYETELLIHPNLGESYYLVHYNEADFLMYYKPSVSHDVASCTYEVFYLSDAGEKIIFESNEIDIFLLQAEELDKTAWKNFAEDINKFFSNAFLLVDTNEAKLEYSTSDKKITYEEKFAWLLNKADVESIEDALEHFIKNAQELYKN